MIGFIRKQKTYLVDSYVNLSDLCKVEKDDAIENPNDVVKKRLFEQAHEKRINGRPAKAQTSLRIIAFAVYRHLHVVGTLRKLHAKVHVWSPIGDCTCAFDEHKPENHKG